MCLFASYECASILLWDACHIFWGRYFALRKCQVITGVSHPFYLPSKLRMF